MPKDLAEGSGVLEELEGLEEVLEGLEVEHTEQCLDVQELHYTQGRKCIFRLRVSYTAS